MSDSGNVYAIAVGRATGIFMCPGEQYRNVVEPYVKPLESKLQDKKTQLSDASGDDPPAKRKRAEPRADPFPHRGAAQSGRDPAGIHCKFWNGKPGSCRHANCIFVHETPAPPDVGLEPATATTGAGPPEPRSAPS